MMYPGGYLQQPDTTTGGLLAQTPQDPQQQGGLLGMSNQDLMMLGLAMVGSDGSNVGQALSGAFTAITKNQQLKQQQAQEQQKMLYDQSRLQQYQQQLDLTREQNQQQYGMQQANLDLERQKYGQDMAQTERKKELYAQLQSLVGEQPNMINGFQGTGMLGGGLSKQDFNAMAAPLLAELGDTQGILSVGKAPEQFTLSPGQTRFDAEGNTVASGGVDKSQTQTIENKLRDEYTAQSKTFTTINDAYGKIVQVAQNVSAAGDMSIIYNFMRMLDPASSVKEQEFANARSTAGLPEQVKVAYDRLKSGNLLTPAMRADFVNQAANIYQSQLDSQTQMTNQYTDIANRAGVNPQNVIVDYRVQEREKTGAKLRKQKRIEAPADFDPQDPLPGVLDLDPLGLRS